MKTVPLIGFVWRSLKVVNGLGRDRYDGRSDQSGEYRCAIRQRCIQVLAAWPLPPSETVVSALGLAMSCIWQQVFSRRPHLVTILPVSFLSAFSVVAASAQVPASTEVASTFEVASIRPSASTNTRFSSFSRGNTFVITNMPLRRIVAMAYGIPFEHEPYRIVGGEDRILSTRFDIQAKAPDGTATEHFRPMLRALLAERFELRIHRQHRQGAVYALKVRRDGTLGPELRPSKHNCVEFKAALARNGTPVSEVARPHDARNRPLCLSRRGDPRPPPGAIQIRDAGAISELVAGTQGFWDRLLLDETRLTGIFEWQLTFSLGPLPKPDAGEPSIAVAMAEQLGLTVERQTGPVDTLFIDSVGMPTPN